MAVRAAMLAAILWPVMALAGQNGKFFDMPPQPPRSRAAFSPAEREGLLENAYACNRATAIGEWREQCVSTERAAQQAITDRTRSNHRQAEPMRQDLRRIYDMNSFGR